MIEDPQGLDLAALHAWLSVAEPTLAKGQLSASLITGGKSNLTYTVSDGTSDYVVRRPPLGHVLATAHDMGREHTVVSAMAATRVPVPQVAGYCTDESVSGAPFYVMDFVAGPVLRQRADVESFPEEGDRRSIGERVVDTLVEIHAVVPDDVGLGELGKKDDYVKRQLRRWQGQWEGSKTREVPLVESVSAKLSARIPEQGPAAIVHGDYRLDNMILTDSGEVAAVVDWELCTLGDPLADVGLLLVYWGEEGDSLLPLFEPATMAPGFPSRADVRARYAEGSGRDLGEIDFYVALGYWKLAIILEGVYSRYAKGQYGKPEAGFEEFGKNVGKLAAAADEAVERLP